MVHTNNEPTAVLQCLITLRNEKKIYLTDLLERINVSGTLEGGSRQRIGDENSEKNEVSDSLFN